MVLLLARVLLIATTKPMSLHPLVGSSNLVLARTWVRIISIIVIIIIVIIIIVIIIIIKWKHHVK